MTIPCFSSHFGQNDTEYIKSGSKSKGQNRNRLSVGSQGLMYGTYAMRIRCECFCSYRWCRSSSIRQYFHICATCQWFLVDLTYVGLTFWTYFCKLTCNARKKINNVGKIRSLWETYHRHKRRKVAPYNSDVSRPRVRVLFCLIRFALTFTYCTGVPYPIIPRSEPFLVLVYFFSRRSWRRHPRRVNPLRRRISNI